MTAPTPDEVIRVLAGSSGIALAVDEDSRLHQIAFGAEATTVELRFPTTLYPLAYPTFGEEPLREPALRCTHADGAVMTRLIVRDVGREAHGSGELVRISCTDRVAPTAVDLVFRTWPDHGLLEQWVEVTNTGADDMVVHEAASTAVAFRAADPWLTHWGGGWAAEWTETTEHLGPGVKVLRGSGGVRSSLYLPPIVLVHPDGRATEDAGDVDLCTVLWGGDTVFRAEIALHRQGRLLAGESERAADRVLAAGERHRTPTAVWTSSEGGVGPTSRALHRWIRDVIVRDGDRRRAVVANTWEAMGFALAPEALTAQIDRAADLGAELFLLDDGWFGSTHPRDDDTQGLGDWVVDRRKLPDGLNPIIDHTLARGLRFGLWVEPEMVNPRSDLYEEHPDWVIGVPDRDRRPERSQLVLDLARPEVQAFCVGVIDRVLADHPGISYLKWDANRDISEPGSAGLPAGLQTHLAHDRVQGTWEVMAEVARRHPGVELMLCASGGGRSDLGTLRFFHELWTSDNTDPVDRVRIQWGASHLLPALVQGAHVTRWGSRDLAFGCAVALSGRFGFDLDLTGLSPQEWTIARQAVDANRRLAPIVQFGDLHRLVSPVGGTRCAVAFVSADRAEAAVFAYRLPDDPEDGPALTLDPLGLGTGRWDATELTPGAPDAATAQPTSTDPVAVLSWPAAPGPSARVWLLRRG